MNRRHLHSLLLAAAWPACMPGASAAAVHLAGDTAAAAEVWSAFQAWLRAYEAGDLPQIMAIFDRGVVFAFQGSADQSYDDLQRSYEDDLKTRKPGTRWLPLVDEVYADAGLAFVRATWELHVADGAAQDVVKASNRSLDVLRKDRGSWRIIRSINYPQKP